MSLRPTTTTTTIHGDVGVLTYAPLDPVAIEASVRSAKAGAVVSFVRAVLLPLSLPRLTSLVG